MSVRRRDKRVWLVLLGVFVAAFLFAFLNGKFKDNQGVDAASLANFDPGYIISDYQMGNYNSMSEAEIQAFLTAKNPCSNTNYSYYQQLSRNSNYRWHWANGHFVCLSEERFGYNDNEIGSGETAAHIIWQAAQDYKINPQVLIVLLQKETGLITDPIPNNGDYRKATGYGCPDTEACSSKYYGFRNQIRNAAALFRTVLDGGWTNYPLGNNYIQYNPSAACGGSVVNIRSLATSALYRYTPYQPNAGALAAGYGTASCGAYGNRNFYLYFEDWFGGIIDYRAEMAIQERYKDIDGEDVLGQKVNGMNCNIGHNGACVQAYKNGVIIYSPNTGAWENYGNIRKRYVEIGSVDNERLGFPTGSVNCYKKGNEQYCVQAYERGIIVDSSHGAWENFGMIRQRYIQLGSVNSSLGFPVGKENCNIGHNGACVQQYEDGVIIAQVSTGAWESYGEIRKKHIAFGSIDGRLGFPIGGVEIVNGIQTQKFQGGSL